MTRGRIQGKLRFGLTDAGKMLLRGIVYVGLAALVVPAFGVLAVLISVMLAALAIGYVARPRIAVNGSLPERIMAGETAELAYTLTNVGRLTAYNLSLQFHGLPDAVEQIGDARGISRLGPGESAQIAVTIRPQRRGCYALRPPVCRSDFPFHLFHFGTAHGAEETLIVLPSFSLLPMALPCRSRQVTASGVRLAGRTGASPEYVGNRPFVSGDSPRRIDVRAWARLAVPATKEYDNDLDSYAALILDTRVPETPAKAKAKENPELEAAISLCASVAYTIHRDHLIDLLLAGPELHVLAGLPKVTRLDRIHETLAAVAPLTDYQFEPIGPLWEERLPEISEAIFILSRWDGMYRQLVEWADRAGCHCTVVLVEEPGPADFGLNGNRNARPQSARDETPWAGETSGDVRRVSAGDILAGRIERL